MVIRLADKSEKQLSGEAEEAREMLKKLLGLQEVQYEYQKEKLLHGWQEAHRRA